MKGKTRKDIHRPAEVVPNDYKYLFSLSYPGASEGGINVALLVAVVTGKPQWEPMYGVKGARVVVVDHVEVVSPWGQHDRASVEHSGGCDFCGANFRHGDVYLHTPSDEVVVIGHMCGDKMGMMLDKGGGRGLWTGRAKELAKLRKTAAYLKAKAEGLEKIKTEAVEFLSKHDGLEEALEVDHRIIRDIKEKLWQWGNLSEKQVAFVHKLADEVLNPVEEDNNDIEPPEGRVLVEGEVLSTRWDDNGYGGALKMLVKVETDEGDYRLWGTAPAAIIDSIGYRYEDGGHWVGRPDPKRQGLLRKGDRVKFSATVTPKEKGFGFFSRPTKGEMVSCSMDLEVMEQEIARRAAIAEELAPMFEAC